MVNIYAPNIGAPKYIKQILTDIKREIHSNTIIVGDSNSPLTSIYRLSRQKINKGTPALNDTSDLMDLIDIPTEHSMQMQQNTHSLKCTWSILQDISYARPQNKPWYI